MGARLTALAMIASLALTGGLARVTSSGAQSPDSEPPIEYTGDVIVKFKPGATTVDVAEALEAADAAAVDSSPQSGLVLLEPDLGQSVDDAVAQLESNPDVLFAEPDTVVRIAATPTDPHYATYQWNLPQIGLPTAWDTTTGNTNVIVAVIDTGVDAAHTDLSGKVTTGANAGYNFVANNTTTTDDNSHGTFVAGIIAANTNNGSGGAGVCWSCKIMAVKVLDNTGSGSSFNVAQGIDWAVSHGADVINLSLGGGAASALQTSVDNAWSAGIVVVAATGNDNGPVLYPAAYSNAIAVGSNDQAGTRSSFSNYGSEIDIMAPGGSVLGPLCTCNGYSGGYGTGSGTSFASPHVAGVVGLMIAAGITDKTDIRNRILTTATDMDVAGFDNNTGWGRINAAAAISAQYKVVWGSNTLPSALAPGATTTANVSFTNAGALSWSAGGGTPVRFAYHWKNSACPGSTNATWDGIRSNLTSDVAPGGTVSNLNATIQAPAAPGTYCLQYDLVHEGVTWFSTQGATTQNQTVTVATPQYGIGWGANTLPIALAPGGTTQHAVTFTNTGALTWSNSGVNAVKFAYHWLSGACPGTVTAIFDGLRTGLPANVVSGGTVAGLNVSIQAPASPGTYCLQYDLVREGITWFSWQGATMQQQDVSVAVPQYAVTWGSNTLPTTLAPGTTTNYSVSFANAGALTWDNGGVNPVRFSYHWHNGDCSANNSVLIYGSRTLLSAAVATGQSVTNLNASITAPASVGTYCLRYDLVRELVTWFSWQGASTQSQTVSVVQPQYGVSWGANALPTTLTAGSTTQQLATFTNTGSLLWDSAGANPVRFAYQWRAGDCSENNPVLTYGIRTLLTGDVPPGETVTSLNASLMAPDAAGTYCLRYDLVREFVTWFSWQGAATQSQTVNVTAPQYAVTWSPSNALPTSLNAGQFTVVSATFTNDGSLTWVSNAGPNPVLFSYHWRNGACSGTTSAIYDGFRTSWVPDVAPGATMVNLQAVIQAPPTPGTYCLQYDLVREGLTWFSWQGADVQQQTVTVN